MENFNQLILSTSSTSSTSLYNIDKYKHPITSYGIILFRKIKDEYQYLMLRRKNSFGFIDFVKGQYSETNITYLQQLFNEMSNEEKLLIQSIDNFDLLWKIMWDDYKTKTNMKNLSKQKFNNLKTNGTITFLINNSSTNWIETEWEFPKGRKNYLEREIECSLREFEEETGILRNNICIVDNILPFEELFIGTNNKYYKNKYFLAYTNNFINSDDLLNFQQSEVSKLEWKNIHECLESIRPYNLEKQKLIQNIHNTLTDYIII